jgi:hypothetical protein
MESIGAAMTRLESTAPVGFVVPKRGWDVNGGIVLKKFFLLEVQ